MNPESPTPREQREARLTALLLGELPPDESAALQEIISKDAQLAALHGRLKQTIELVRETAMDPAELATEPPAPRRLGEERRQKLLAQFKTVTPQEFARPRPQRSPRRIILEMAAVIALLVCLSGLLLPSLARSKAKAQHVSRLASIRQEELARKLSVEELSEVQDRKPAETVPLPIAAPEANSMPAPTGSAELENRAPKRETIVLPSTVDTDQFAGGGNARDFKFGENYTLNTVVPSDGAKKELAAENKDAHAVQDLALLSGDVQDKLSTANDVRLRENIEKEKADGATAPVALGVDKTAIDFNESNGQNLRGTFVGGRVVTGTTQQEGDTELAGLNQTASTALPGVTVGEASAPLGAAPSGIGGGGGVGGVGGAKPGVLPVPVSQTPALSVAKPVPTTENLTFYNSGALTGRSSTLNANSSATGEPAGRQMLSVRTLNTVTLANAEPQEMLKEIEVTTESGRSSSQTEQNVLTQRAQTVQQNVASAEQFRGKSVGFGGFGNVGGGTYPTNYTGPVTPSYDAETHSIIWLSDGRSADSVSNLVAQLDTSAGKTQAGV